MLVWVWTMMQAFLLRVGDSLGYRMGAWVVMEDLEMEKVGRRVVDTCM